MHFEKELIKLSKVVRKIVLIEPGPPGYHIYKRVPIWRQGLPQIGVFQKSKGKEVVVIAEILTRPINASDWEDIKQADAVGISSITCTAPRAYELARVIKNELGKPVILGGPHVTFDPEEATKYGDVARFDGYHTFDEWIKYLEGEITDKKSIKGLAFRENNRYYRNPPRARDFNLRGYLYPDNTLVKGYKKANIIPLMFSLSCTKRCSFCSVVPMFGRCWRHYPAERVVEEMEKFKDQATHFFITDDSLFDNPQETMKLIKAKINSDAKHIKWSAQTTVSAPFVLDKNREPIKRNGEYEIDHERLEALRESGFRVAYQGHESINPETLDDYGKNQTPEMIAQSVEALLRYLIRTHGMYVLGGKHDTPETVEKTVNFIIRSGIASVQLCALVPILGSKDYREYKERVFNWDFEDWDGQYVVFHPKKISAFELQKGIEKGLKEIYKVKNCLSPLLRFPLGSKTGTIALRLYGHNLVNNGLIKNRRYHKILEKIIRCS